MKKEIKIAILILIGFLTFLWLEKPLREYLSINLFNEQIAKQISSITIRIMLIGVVFALIKKFQHIEFTGLNNWKKLKNVQAIIAVSAFIMIGLFQNWNTYINTEIDLLILFAMSTVTVGVVEELVFRGTVFPLFIKSFKKANRPIIISAVLSSLMFGLIHFVNIFSQPENLIGITSQVFFATSIGVFFCGLMIRTENILIPCIVHALINFSFGAGELKQSIVVVSKIEETTGINWNSVIPTTIFFSFILVGGIYMILKADKLLILSELEV
jgi:membrane protease YdiL (CAAX protease family)